MSRILLMLWALCSCWTAAAHGNADNHLQVLLVDNRVKMNITVDMRVLQAVDDDGDGSASLEELAAHRDSLQSWIRQSMAVADQAGNPGERVFADVTSDLNIARDHGDRVEHARILQTLVFDDVPEELRIDVAALARVLPELRVTVVDASTGLRYALRDPLHPQTVIMPAR